MEVLTFRQRHQRDVVGEDALGDGRAGRDAGVVAGVRGVDLGDVEVPVGLGDKAPLVQRDEGGEQGLVSYRLKTQRTDLRDGLSGLVTKVLR